MMIGVVSHVYQDRTEDHILKTAAQICKILVWPGPKLTFALNSILKRTHQLPGYESVTTKRISCAECQKKNISSSLQEAQVYHLPGSIKNEKNL